MKLNYKSILIAATLMVVASNANASMVYDIYAGGTAGIGGMAISSDKLDRSNWSSNAYGAIFGIDLPVVRFEAEYNYLTSDKIDMHTIMGNAYVKLLGVAVVNPYIGVGVGMMLDAETKYDIDIDPTIAYQGMLGATINIPTLPFKIDLEGRAMVLPEIAKINKDDIDALQYDARVKLRYVF